MNVKKQRKISFLLVLLLAGINNAFAQYTQFYVSPLGSNFNVGSKEKPWKTLEYAKDQARKVEDYVVINLFDGIYTLNKSLTLSSEDSNISFKAVDGSKPIISGGVKITRWKDTNKDGIWTAKVSSGLEGRHLYINGKRAIRARTVNADGWERIAHTPKQCGSVSCRDDENTPNGFKVPKDFPKLSNVADVEMVNIMRWKMYRGKLHKIEDNIAYVDQKYWDLAKIGPFGLLNNKATEAVNWLENAIEFLDEDGEWYLDKKNGTLYYKPRQGEQLNESDVVISNVEKLVNADGVENVSFEGITFAYANWNQPSTSLGYVSIQSGAVLADPDYQSIEDAFEGLVDIPGNVHFKNSRNVVMKGNTFQHLGGTALNFDTNNQYVNIFGNTFNDISGSAITIGNLQDHHIVNEKISREIIIDNNSIKNVGVEYWDVCAIKCSFVKDAAIVNNSINGSSAGGITLGWGWGRYDVDNFDFWKDGSDKAYNHPTVAGGVLVAHNKITNVTTKLGDTAAIYNLGASPDTKWYANYIENVAHPEARFCSAYSHGIYIDNGSRGIEIKDNIVIGSSHEPYLANGSHDYNIRGEAYYYKDDAGEYPAWIKEKSGVKPEISELRHREEIEKLFPEALPVNNKFYIETKGVAVGRNIIAVGSAINSKASFATDGKTETYWRGKGKEGELVLDLGKVSDIYYVNSAFGYIEQGTKKEVYFKNGYEFEYFTSMDGIKWTSYGEGKKVSTLAINQQYGEDQKPVEARYVKLKVHSSGDHQLGVLRFKVVDQEPVYGGRKFGPQ
ncbi:F5/8 type C domain-containing protein [Gelidibacter sediminis]|uniref:F5/8 type C domain-containing protein n=1 Tax=Gelidibacter sediminis TaxID=1608710 RepID=A0A4R7Q042_9FLAO|nr:discoidin domain-containing protein [Gelidibacter sediminis]TDU39811.1 F5/8 type C domain-containing protein [Gelidibacter sediminis]